MLATWETPHLHPRYGAIFSDSNTLIPYGTASVRLHVGDQIPLGGDQIGKLDGGAMLRFRILEKNGWKAHLNCNKGREFGGIVVYGC